MGSNELIPSSPIELRDQTGLVDEVFNADSSFRWDVFSGGSSGKPLSLTALWACVSMLSGDLSRLPLNPFNRRPDGSKELADDHQTFGYVNSVEGEANPETTSLNMWRTAYLQACLHGASYIWMDWSANGRLLGMYNLCPHTTCRTVINGRRCFVGEMVDDYGQTRLIQFDNSEIFYIPFLSFDSIRCEGPLKLFRDLFNGALEKRKQVAKYVKSSFGQAGLLVAPPEVKLETIRKTQDAIAAHLTSNDSMIRTMALRAGWSYESIGATLREADLATHSEADVREIARIFNIPPGMIGAIQSNNSFASAEIAWLQYLNSTLSPWLATVRSEANMKLRSIPEKQNRSLFFEHTVSSYEYVSTETKSKFLVDGLTNGYLCIDDARDVINKPRLPNGLGQQFARPLNIGVIKDESAKDQNNTGTGTDDTDADGGGNSGGGAGNRSAGVLDNHTPEQRNAIQALANNAISRTKSRIANIRLRKIDPRSDAKEMDTLREMVTPACQILGLDATQKLNELLDI